MKPVLVTGATGNVGRRVVAALVARGISVRAAMKQPAAGRATGAVPVAFDFGDPQTFAPAVRDARAVFLLRPPAISHVESTLNRFADVARDEGVEHIVFLSVTGADRTRYIPHYKVERHLEQLGIAYTFLRAGFFAQNLGDAYRDDIRDADRLYVPAGSGKAAFVDVRDVAELAAIAFAAPEQHARKAYALTGPEALSFDVVAELLTATLGRSIRYDRASSVGYFAHVRRKSGSSMQALVQTMLHVGLRFGQAERVDPTLAVLLGRAPSPLAAYIADHASVWLRP